MADYLNFIFYFAGLFGARPDERDEKEDESAEKEFSSLFYGNGEF